MTTEFFQQFANRFQSTRRVTMSFQEYLEQCRDDPSSYATAAERMLAAIGEPRVVDTSQDERLARIFANRKVRLYTGFEDFYGMEEPIEQIVSYFRHAAQGLEERKQVLYLLGPMGGGKSSLAERLKELFETIPFYTLQVGDEISPLYESPLGLLDYKTDGAVIQENYGIPRQYLKPVLSPWASKRLVELNGDITQFKVVKLYPSQMFRIGIAKAEPGDESTQDQSCLVGKVDIRKLEDYSQDDPDAYSYSGALNACAQGLVDFAEMFKANIKTLNPLLTATQEGHYQGTEGFSSMPFNGVIVAHSNQAEWESFRNNKRNEAFIDRLCIVRVPYCLRVTEEVEIYRKLLENSSLAGAACAPGTLEMLAQWSVLSRLHRPENSNAFSKMEVYNGVNLKDKDPAAKSHQEYRDEAGPEEGMDGMSTRFAYKVLSHVFNYDPLEVAANPVHLMYVLEKRIEAESLKEDVRDTLLKYIKGTLAPKYAEFLGNEIQTAYLDSYSSFGQNMFDRYIAFADAWCNKSDYRDPDTGEQFDRESLNSELEKTEKPAGIGNPLDFRNEVVRFVFRQRAMTGKTVEWTSYEKLRSVIEKRMFSHTEDLIPIITFGKKATQDEEKKHEGFVDRMMEKGYTRKQVELIALWYTRYRKHN